MPAPQRLARKFQEKLGNEAADDMVEWMNRIESELARLRAEMNLRFVELRQEMNGRFAAMQGEMNDRFAAVDSRFVKVDAEFSTLRHEMRVGFAQAEASAAKRHADFMKWTLGFWAASLMTMVGAIAALARILG